MVKVMVRPSVNIKEYCMAFFLRTFSVATHKTNNQGYHGQTQGLVLEIIPPRKQKGNASQP